MNIKEIKLGGVVLTAFLLVFILSIGQAQAAHWIVGVVNDAGDGEQADGHTAVLYKAGNPSDSLADTIGDKIEDGYQIDCELLETPCVIDDVLTVEVIDDGDGYTAGPVEVTVTGAGWDEAPAMTLTPGVGCEVEDFEISVGVDKEEYCPGEGILVSGTLIDSECSPVSGADIGLEITSPEAQILVDQTETDINGEFYYSFVLSSESPAGEYTVWVSYNFDDQSESDSENFDVLSCERSCYTGPSGTNGVGVCHGGTQTYIDGEWGPCEGQVTPQAPACNGKDNNCNGFVDSGYDIGCGGGGGSSGGGVVYCGNGECDGLDTCETCPEDCGECCEEDWACTGWSACQPDGIQTRTCTDDNDCGTTESKPIETQSCVPAPPSPPETQEICGNDICETGETCETCEDDCGACPPSGQAEVTPPPTGGFGLLGMFTAEQVTGGGVLALLIIALILILFFMKKGKSGEKKVKYDFTRKKS